MFNPDDSELTFTTDGSRLLSEPSLLASESISTGQEDLSLSDLSIHGNDAVLSRPFSLLSRPEPTTPTQQTSYLEAEGENAVVEERVEEVDEEAVKKQRAKAREEKLQSDVFILKKLNSAFAAFNKALDNTGSINDKIAKQLAQTDSLLNKYVEILYRSEDVSRLIFDEDWEGAEADEEQLEREHKEAIERARREEEERKMAIQRENERREREEREREEKEAQERLEQEKRERMAARGGRGVVRRGVPSRGTARGASTTGISRLGTSESSGRIRQSVSGLPTRRTTGSTTGRVLPSAGSSRGSSGSRKQ